MKIKWNNNLNFEKPIIAKCKKIKPVDIMVGVLCKDVETTVLNVLNVVNEGLYRYFPENKKAIVISEGESTDKTAEVIELFRPYNSISKIVTKDITSGGKGAGVRTILEIAHLSEAKSVVLIDGDLLRTMTAPVRNVVGIDLGIKTLLTLSNGETIDNPRWINSNEKKLKKLQKQLSKKQKGSNNRYKAKLKLAKVHETIHNQKTQRTDRNKVTNPVNPSVNINGSTVK